jgi:hypothetical protein
VSNLDMRQDKGKRLRDEEKLLRASGSELQIRGEGINENGAQGQEKLDGRSYG